MLLPLVVDLPAVVLVTATVMRLGPTDLAATGFANRLLPLSLFGSFLGVAAPVPRFTTIDVDLGGGLTELTLERLGSGLVGALSCLADIR